MKGFIFVIVGAILWSFDGIFRYPLLQSFTAETIVFYEHLFLGAVFLPPFLLGLKDFRAVYRPGHLFYFLVIGAGGAAWASVFYTKAFSLMNPSVVILLQKLQPFVSVFLAYSFLKEPIRKEFLLWGGVCVVGAILVGYRDVQGAQETLGEAPLRGLLYALLATVGWGTATVFGRKLILEGYRTAQMMQGRYLTALLSLLPLMLMGDHSFSLPPAALFKVVLMAVLSGLVGVYFYYRGLSLIPARICTIGELFFPLGAVALNWMVLGIPVHPVQLVGGAVLCIGAAMIRLK